MTGTFGSFKEIEEKVPVQVGTLTGRDKTSHLLSFLIVFPKAISNFGSILINFPLRTRMAESFLSEIAADVVGKLGSFALKDVCFVWGLETELEKIKEMLIAIQAVILDAKQQQEQSEGVKFWVEKLTQVLYDVEDVLDEFDYEVLRKQVVKCMSTSRKVRRFFSASNPLVFRLKMGHKLKNVRERVAEIACLKSKLGLTERVNERHVIRKEREMSHSFVDVADVVGREGDKKRILEHLLNVADGENVSVLPIVGIGGLGKTALAKLVYNDQRIKEHFDLKLWICISDDFDSKKVIIKILKSAGQTYQDMDLDQLQLVLRETMDGKKYLLVMDDVWNDDRKKWLDLRSLLMGGNKGSKILVTTRSNKVALIMGTVGRYELDDLPHENCLSLFFKCAFQRGQEEHYPNLKNIGEEIVRKCRGVPLAVITLGSLLYTTTNDHDWKFVRNNEIWRLEQKENDIMPALKLSYEQLPSYLKKCFAYCSLFPKNYEFNNFELIQFWMANGLLQSSNACEELEDVGDRYLNELRLRGFLQDFNERFCFVGCKMHDLMHDLALSVAQSESCMITSVGQNFSKNVRHFTFLEPQSFPQDYLSSLDNLEQMRTIFFLNAEKEFDCEAIIETFFARFQHVRVIDLYHCQFEILPRSIATLKHLRYFDLGRNYKIKELPNFICKLQNLQTLILINCKGLEELPKDIKCMVSLRFLWVTISGKRLPKGGIGCLKSLRTLALCDCENLEYLMEDMQGLINLRNLYLTNCNKLIVLPQSTKYLNKLERLIINKCENLDWTIEEDNSNLSHQKLRILGFGKLPKLEELPQWLLPKSANILQLLIIQSCHSLKQLPGCLQNQSAIQELRIKDCELLSERCKFDTGEDWYKIAHIPKILVDDINLRESTIN